MNLNRRKKIAHFLTMASPPEFPEDAKRRRRFSEVFSLNMLVRDVEEMRKAVPKEAVRYAIGLRLLSKLITRNDVKIVLKKQDPTKALAELLVFEAQFSAVRFVNATGEEITLDELDEFSGAILRQERVKLPKINYQRS